MTAILSGLALHGGFIPYGGTFLTFSDYARNAVRMAALMKQGSILVYSHDSIGLGEDGPTHQPIEHLASLRLIPEHGRCGARAMRWRPRSHGRRPSSDAMGRQHSCSTRQNVPHQPRSADQIAGDQAWGLHADRLRRARRSASSSPRARRSASLPRPFASSQKRGRRVRLVSMPCFETFLRNDAAYRERVLPAAVRKRVSVEAGVTRDLVAVCRGRGPHHRHGSFRRFGQGVRPVQAFRLHRRARARDGRGTSRRTLKCVVNAERQDHGDQGGHQRLRPHRP